MKWSYSAAAAVLVCAVLANPAPLCAEPAPFFLSDGFENGDFAGEGGLFYKKNQEQERGSVRFQGDVVRAGKRALELSVEPSCAVSGTECSERAEVWERAEVLAPYSQSLWYAFSMKLGTPVPQEPHRLVMAQWKREILPGAAGDFSPFLALRLVRGRIGVSVVSDQAHYAPIGTPERPERCLPGEAMADAPDAFGQVRATVAVGGGTAAMRADLPGCAPSIRVIDRGGSVPAADDWIDFVFMVHPDPSGKGALEIAANGRWIATVEGTIGHAGPGLADTQYFKFGPYRAGRPDRWTIYYDEFRRSSRCIDVTGAALCEAIQAGSGRS